MAYGTEECMAYITIPATEAIHVRKFHTIHGTRKPRLLPSCAAEHVGINIKTAKNKPSPFTPSIT